MAVKIIKEPDVYLTQSEYNRLMAEYHKAFSMYAGTPPTFEEWVRRSGRSGLDYVEHVVASAHTSNPEPT